MWSEWATILKDRKNHQLRAQQAIQYLNTASNRYFFNTCILETEISVQAALNFFFFFVFELEFWCRGIKPVSFLSLAKLSWCCYMLLARKAEMNAIGHHLNKAHLEWIIRQKTTGESKCKQWNGPQWSTKSMPSCKRRCANTIINIFMYITCSH